MIYKMFGILMGILLIIPIITVNANDEMYNSTTPKRNDDWPMFRYDPSHVGFTDSYAPNTNNLLWTSFIGNTPESSPAVSNGKVIVGTKNMGILCYDALTGGDPIWTCTIPGSITYSSPSITDDFLYVGSYYIDWNVSVIYGILYCIDVNNGEEIWNYSIEWSPIYSSPTVANGYVYFGTQDNAVYCLDANPLDDGIDEGIQDDPLAGYDLVWRFEAKNDFTSSPTIYNNKLFIGSLDGILYCLNASVGSLEWTYETLDSISYSTPAVYDDHVYFGSWDYNIYCLDVEGNFIWNYTTNEKILSSPAVAYDKVYIGSYDNTLYCLDSIGNGDGTTTKLWDFNTDEGIFSSPAVADQKVYFGSRDNKIYCLDAINGDLIWNYTTGNGIGSSPAIANSVVYITSTDGNIYAFQDENMAPISPVITGPLAAGPEITVEFTIFSEDPEAEQILYFIDWGDGNSSGWLGPYDSSESITVNYTWFQKGFYEISVIAKDASGIESAISYHPITIDKQISFDNIKPGYFYLKYLSYNKSYAYISLFDDLGISGVLTDDDVEFISSANDIVEKVKFIAVSLLFGDNITIIDEDGSDGFKAIMELPLGIYSVTTYAYDENNNMIDYDLLVYFFCMRVGSNQQEFGRLGRLKRIVST